MRKNALKAAKAGHVPDREEELCIVIPLKGAKGGVSKILFEFESDLQ